jgi:UPF0148 protein
MADMLRQGATLTELSCPACSSPIFRMQSGELWCGHCKKRVIVIKEGDSTAEATSSVSLAKLEITLLSKIEETEGRINEESDPEKLEMLGRLLSTLLENLEKIRRTKG